MFPPARSNRAFAAGSVSRLKISDGFVEIWFVRGFLRGAPASPSPPGRAGTQYSSLAVDKPRRVTAGPVHNIYGIESNAVNSNNSKQ